MSGIFDQWLIRIQNASAISSRKSASILIEVVTDFFRIELYTEELFRVLVRDKVIRDDTLMQMEAATAYCVQKITQTSLDKSIFTAYIIWGAARQFAVSGLMESPSNILAELIYAIAGGEHKSKILN